MNIFQNNNNYNNSGSYRSSSASTLRSSSTSDNNLNGVRFNELIGRSIIVYTRGNNATFRGILIQNTPNSIELASNFDRNFCSPRNRTFIRKSEIVGISFCSF